MKEPSQDDLVDQLLSSVYSKPTSSKKKGQMRMSPGGGRINFPSDSTDYSENPTHQNESSQAKDEVAQTKPAIPTKADSDDQPMKADSECQSMNSDKEFDEIINRDDFAHQLVQN